MKKQAIDNSKNLKLVIEEDENVGYYLLEYEINTGKCVYDNLYFPNQLDDLYGEALSKYGIDRNMFKDLE